MHFLWADFNVAAKAGVTVAQNPMQKTNGRPAVFRRTAVPNAVYLLPASVQFTAVRR